jgi:O-acetylhomoserine/O-acetylserine sulfhydrylase-like pyridoxal-dependent enzyme
MRLHSAQGVSYSKKIRVKHGFSNYLRSQFPNLGQPKNSYRNSMLYTPLFKNMFITTLAQNYSQNAGNAISTTQKF